MVEWLIEKPKAALINRGLSYGVNVLRKKNFAGIIELMDNGLHPFSWILKILEKRSHGGLSAVRLLAEMEAEAKEIGIIAAAQNLFNKLQIGLDISGEIGFSGPRLFVGLNHQAMLEPFALFAILESPDLCFIGNAIMQCVGPQTRELILAVMPLSFASGSGSSIAGNLYHALGLSEENIRVMNSKSLRKAAELLTEGDQVAIFPTGGQGISGRWHNGIGTIFSHLLSFPSDQLEAIGVVPVKFSGLAEGDFSRLAWQFYREGVDSPSDYHIEFGEQRNMSDLMANLGLADLTEPRQIANFLRGQLVF